MEVDAVVSQHEGIRVGCAGWGMQAENNKASHRPNRRLIYYVILSIDLSFKTRFSEEPKCCNFSLNVSVNLQKLDFQPLFLSACSAFFTV